MRPVNHFVLHIERLILKTVLLQLTKMPEKMT